MHQGWDDGFEAGAEVVGILRQYQPLSAFTAQRMKPHVRSWRGGPASLSAASWASGKGAS